MELRCGSRSLIDRPGCVHSVPRSSSRREPPSSSRPSRFRFGSPARVPVGPVHDSKSIAYRPVGGAMAQKPTIGYATSARDINPPDPIRSATGAIDSPISL